MEGGPLKVVIVPINNLDEGYLSPPLYIGEKKNETTVAPHAVNTLREPYFSFFLFPLERNAHTHTRKVKTKLILKMTRLAKESNYVTPPPPFST